MPLSLRGEWNKALRFWPFVIQKRQIQYRLVLFARLPKLLSQSLEHLTVVGQYNFILSLLLLFFVKINRPCVVALETLYTKIAWRWFVLFCKRLTFNFHWVYVISVFRTSAWAERMRRENKKHSVRVHNAGYTVSKACPVWGFKNKWSNQVVYRERRLFLKRKKAELASYWPIKFAIITDTTTFY